MKLEELLSLRNMRLFNLGAIGLIFLANLIRFYYFGKREKFIEREAETTDANGDTVTALVVEKTFARDSFWLMLYTLFVMPTMIFIFILQELQVSNERLVFVL